MTRKFKIPYKEKLFFTMFLLIGINFTDAQTIPVIPVKKEPAKTTPVKPKTVVVTKPGKTEYVEKATNTATIKFRSDVNATLYIDNEKRGSLLKDATRKINLAKGEYIIKAVSNDNENDFLKWNYTVEEAGTERIEEIALMPVITQRLNTETAAEEEKKQKEALLHPIKNIQMINVQMINVHNFAISKYEVTQLQWLAVMGTNPSGHKYFDNCPVENVSWNDVQEFILRLNNLTGKNYRLPTEAEWEFAAKGGSKSQGFACSGSNDINEVAWYESNSGSTTQLLGQKLLNELGIFDMTGNVCEWCIDWYDDSHQLRVVRCGSWLSDPAVSRIADRNNVTPDGRDRDNGFRLASSL